MVGNYVYDMHQSEIEDSVLLGLYDEKLIKNLLYSYQKTSGNEVIVMNATKDMVKEYDLGGLVVDKSVNINSVQFLLDAILKEISEIFKIEPKKLGNKELVISLVNEDKNTNSYRGCYIETKDAAPQ